ncbi:VOC family protein [Bacillus sp. FJAT-42376]|uniref:VOC family protein n=1 Tax=Bacillus sp. FJAT-42376 TaxID=2014076 RepID=UPI000F4E6A40|nr:VOC family protein [Bacillus sp. FJAT-42376]AZB41320.1 VOC family protein [Bacillus sp. FJAT-42376]
MSSQKITPFFMFSGQAEEAMNFYVTVFEDSEILRVLHHPDGKVLHAIFKLKGQTIMCIDNTNGDDHAFTPALSLFITCDTEEEIESVYHKISENGQVMMPLAPGPFSRKFAWVQDQYGISWQLNFNE